MTVVRLRGRGLLLARASAAGRGFARSSGEGAPSIAAAMAGRGTVAGHAFGALRSVTHLAGNGLTSIRGCGALAGAISAATECPPGAPITTTTALAGSGILKAVGRARLNLFMPSKRVVQATGRAPPGRTVSVPR